MKLLIITDEQYPYLMGGGCSYLKDFERGLKYHGVEYEILAPKYYIGSKYEQSNIKNLGIPLKKYNSFILRSLFKFFYFPIWYLAVIGYLLTHRESRKFDIINAEAVIFSGMLALIIGKMFNRKVVITTHGKLVSGFREVAKLPEIMFNMISLLEKQIITRADGIICVGRDVKKFYSKYNKNTYFLPNFIDASIYKKRASTGVKSIAYIGRLSVEKRVDLLIEASKSFPDKKFLIIGEGHEAERLKSLKEKLNARNVFFLGRLNDIPRAHGRIDLIVYLWKNEPFGLSALEAMASGIPVIAADTNELHYFVGVSKSGTVIPRNDLNAKRLRKEIAKFDNKEFYRKCAANAYKTAQEYDYKVLVKKYIQTYDELLK